MPGAQTTHKRLVSLRNWLSVGGLIIAGGGLFAFIFLFSIDLFSNHGNPYLGILAYVVAPGFIISGLVLALIGAWKQHRALRDVDPKAASSAVTIDLTRPRD